MSASYEVHGPVAVITLDNPPVNGMGQATRIAARRGLDSAAADAAVRAIVIRGANGLFSGGADIREFGTERARAEPTLMDPSPRRRQAPSRWSPRSRGLHGGRPRAGAGCHYRVFTRMPRWRFPK